MPKLFERTLNQAAQAEMVEAMAEGERRRWPPLAAAYENAVNHTGVPVEIVLGWLRTHGAMSVAVFWSMCEGYRAEYLDWEAKKTIAQ